MTQQSHYWAYTLRNPELKKTHVTQYSLQHYLQLLEHGSNVNIHQQIKKLQYIYMMEFFIYLFIYLFLFVVDFVVH